MIGVMLIHNDDVIKKTWIILDNCSIDSMAKNWDCVEEVKNCTKDEEVTVLTNGGSLIFDSKERLTFLPLNVHVNNNSPALIISLKYVNNI